LVLHWSRSEFEGLLRSLQSPYSKVEEGSLQAEEAHHGRVFECIRAHLCFCSFLFGSDTISVCTDGLFQIRYGSLSLTGGTVTLGWQEADNTFTLKGTYGKGC